MPGLMSQLGLQLYISHATTAPKWNTIYKEEFNLKFALSAANIKIQIHDQLTNDDTMHDACVWMNCPDLVVVNKVLDAADKRRLLSLMVVEMWRPGTKLQRLDNINDLIISRCLTDWFTTSRIFQRRMIRFDDFSRSTTIDDQTNLLFGKTVPEETFSRIFAGKDKY